MESAQFLQSLREHSLEEGKDYIQAHATEIADLAAMGNMLAEEALAQLYSPFNSLKLAELLTFLVPIRGTCFPMPSASKLEEMYSRKSDTTRPRWSAWMRAGKNSYS